MSASDPVGEVAQNDQPGLNILRAAVRRRPWLRLPKGAALRQDAMAGLSSAISNVPDGMANGALLGVNPVHGLYGTIFGPAVGGALVSTQLMMITTMAAASLSASQALGGLTGQARADGLFAMVLLVGALQLGAGWLRLGRFLRFVSYSVTLGFLTGVSVLLILNQLPDVTGRDAPGGVTGAVQLLSDLGSVHLPTLALAALTLLLAVLLPRTKVGQYGRLFAVVVPSLLALLPLFADVQLVRDTGTIPKGLPLPSLPPLSAFTPGVITGAIAVALIILVQSAGVGQSVPNPDGARHSSSRDFMAIGAANMVSGLFRGAPVGGSVSGTALNVLYGGQSRWASIFAGLIMAVIVLAFSGAVGVVAMPALGALLILAGVSSIKPRDIRLVVEAGWPSWLAGGTTFVAMLFLPIQAAVGFGVVLSAFLYITQASTDISLVELVRHDDGAIEERKPPATLSARQVTVLDGYGQLFYAGAHTLERLLPRVGGAERPVVVLRLRGLASMGATLLEVLARYARDIGNAGGRLYLSGVDPAAHRQIVRTGRLDLQGPVRIHEATAFRGQSTRAAVEESEEWLVSVAQEPGDG
ncbi:SulP family inorganic anion transporter [Aerolutibacter ruishenii]|uniref:SulP family sulfate permease n=1 Tax=Aerolutibacter ruishenii TaxID=686800 RepID=A0A562LCL7_9GAMM|nr:SulP family inorganic anion transporter [Lysobacter ruishenii]TWI05393.1 SulP family sulfate permease [Lysobacter ruishenii]